MKAPTLEISSILLFLLCLVVNSSRRVYGIQTLGHHDTHRRSLHQPLFPEGSTPPPAAEPPPPPGSDFPNPDQPFFPEVPTGPTPDQTQTPPSPSANISNPMPAGTQPQPTNPNKKVAIAVSVGIVTLGMLSALAFFLYRHRVRHPAESQKLVGGRNSRQFPQESTAPASDLLYLGTVEPSNHRTGGEPNGASGCGSPYHKLSSVRRSETYRPSPDLQPLPPLSRAPQRNSPPARSSDEEESQETFYSPQGSIGGNGESPSAGVPRRSSPTTNNNNPVINGKASTHSPNSTPHSRRTSPRSRFSNSSPDMKHVIVASPIPPVAPPPPTPPPPPPPPSIVLPRSIKDQSLYTTVIPIPPPPPPPPVTPKPIQVFPRPPPHMPNLKANSSAESSRPATGIDEGNGSLERLNSDDIDGAKPRLKPLHWDKVRATSDRAMVWDQLKSSSFQLNEDMIETLFGCNSTNQVEKEANRRSVLPSVEQENRVLDPKKSQNIAILLRALNVTRDEVSEALIDGNPEGLGAELLETLVKMAPTKEEEIKLRDYSGDISKLGSAERFLKTVLDIPFAFKRVDAMLYRANFDTEVKYLRKSFGTLEAASEELKKSRLFLKLLEAVLRTGNIMNVGTNRGDARAFKLDTLLKLVDIKGTDGKTTLLHFVVQEIIRSEGEGSDSTHDNAQIKMQSKVKEEDFKKQGLQIVAGLSRELSNVKKAAGMDSDVLSSYVSKLETGLGKIRSVLQYEVSNTQGKFFEAMRLFLKEAEDEIARIKAEERKALSLVKEVTGYFHGDTTREEAHPLRIFMVVRDFLSVLDQVCKEVGKMQEKTLVGSTRSFRISANVPLPVLSRYNKRQDESSDEDSSSL